MSLFMIQKTVRNNVGICYFSVISLVTLFGPVTPQTLCNTSTMLLQFVDYKVSRATQARYSAEEIQCKCQDICGGIM
jgi:hypothetical protein